MSSYIKSTYEYTKLRKNFGKQPLFQAVPAEMLDSINPNKDEQKQYALRNPVHRHVQVTMPQSENETNTKQLVMHEQGINHTEGGWPRDIHVYNEDHIQRHIRRIMHDDNYINAVLNIAPTMEHYVNQNNSIEMYQSYFADMNSQEPIEINSIKIANIFRDSYHRPISCVVWTKEKKSKLAVAYCFKGHNSTQNMNIPYDCYVWDICKQTEPVVKLNSENPCWQLACSPVNPEVLIGGFQNGTVNIFDIRVGTKTILSSSIYNSHRLSITSLLYTHSRTNTEFFSGSPDGQCLWWDCRDLSKPLDRLPIIIDSKDGNEQDLNKTEGISTLEYDNGLPTKFLCGTESGFVININRMGKDYSEKISSYWHAHCGPVNALQRSPCTTRMFLTCGDFSVRVWSEEVRTAPIIVTRPYRHLVTDAVWSPQRFSSYMVVCDGGWFYYWDFLSRYKEPSATLQVSQHGLTRITPHTQNQFIAIGDSHGSLHLLQLSENMTEPGIHDKVLMSKTYARETRREHILDTRVKEIRLKAKAEEGAVIVESDSDNTLTEEQLDEAFETEYFNVVNEELRQLRSMY